MAGARSIKAAGTVVTGGAGASHLIEHANQELQRYFENGANRLSNVNHIDLTLSDFAKTFFEESMRGYQGIDYQLVPGFEMLIAINIRPHTKLFHWQGNRMVLIPESAHASIGSGITQLHPMLRDAQFSGTCESMLFLGIRMMRHAKRTVVGVGGKTEAFALQKDGATRIFGTDLTTKIEELVISFEQFAASHLYLTVSNIADDVRHLDENIAKGFASLPKIMAEYRQAYKNILRPPEAHTSQDRQEPSGAAIQGTDLTDCAGAAMQT